MIAKTVGEGRCRAIYCHFDGYPEGTGKTLLDHYASPEKVDVLIGLGDISCLKEEVEADGEDKEHCMLAYARDYGEKLYPAREMTLEEFVRGDTGASYFYLFQNGRWLYSCKGEGLHFRDLREALHAVCAPEQEHEAAERKFGNYFVSTTPDCGIVREDVHGKQVICNGYYCQVYADPDYEHQVDDFCLAVGYEIPDDSEEALERGIRIRLGLEQADDEGLDMKL